MTKIAVITGGSSPERNVALAGAGMVVGALRDRGFEVTVVDTFWGPLNLQQEVSMLGDEVGLMPPTLAELERIEAGELRTGLVELEEVSDSDLLFLVVHGRQGEGGQLQSLFDLAGLSYIGCDPSGSLLAMDKDISKRLFDEAGIPTPRWRLWPAPVEDVARLGLPLVVKPSRVGSTLGLTIVRALDGLEAAVEEARSYDDCVLLESFVEGREFTVGVLDDEPLAVGEIRPQHEIFDYECKYTEGMCEEIFPADIDGDLTSELRELALRAHRTLKLRDFSRLDFRVDRDGGVWCLEANTLPGMTPGSLFPQSAAAAGIPFDELCCRMCEIALARS